ncbi:hypothetical protein AURDEDRAFT_130960 [Auricularia subglabra TFB-10046 SS5]|uniref:Uncharacterized protein n=1 Tax=Auricularia subglabra (strain TFB-10046 / SS5) TaxID=717982 RepID=J0LDQ6_AURST|nr:hypothetical protein AURDEDRAFT_130960 [Auricularia subglabra TFB-10046 SS5]
MSGADFKLCRPNWFRAASRAASASASHGSTARKWLREFDKSQASAARKRLRELDETIPLQHTRLLKLAKLGSGSVDISNIQSASYDRALLQSPPPQSLSSWPASSTSYLLPSQSFLFSAGSDTLASNPGYARKVYEAVFYLTGWPHDCRTSMELTGQFSKSELQILVDTLWPLLLAHLLKDDEWPEDGLRCLCYDLPSEFNALPFWTNDQGSILLKMGDVRSTVKAEIKAEEMLAKAEAKAAKALEKKRKAPPPGKCKAEKREVDIAVGDATGDDEMEVDTAVRLAAVKVPAQSLKGNTAKASHRHRQQQGGHWHAAHNTRVACEGHASSST